MTNAQCPQCQTWPAASAVFPSRPGDMSQLGAWAGATPAGIVMEWNASMPPDEATCWINGEPFRLETKAPPPCDPCVLTHPQWSLCGFGATVAEALADLQAMAKEIAPYYVRNPEANSVPSVRRLRDFLANYSGEVADGLSDRGPAQDRSLKD